VRRPFWSSARSKLSHFPKRDGEIESAIGTVGDLIPGIPHAWRVINRDLIFRWAIVLRSRHPTYLNQGEQCLTRELLKNGDVQKSPLTSLSSPSAIGGHNFNLKIDLASIAGAVGARMSARG
jgi:hypothetical protein